MLFDQPIKTRIQAWDTSHVRFPELVEFIAVQDQTDWFNFSAPWHLGSHVLVALHGKIIVGFLRFVLQHIGSDDDRPAVQFHGVDLVEAKVLAFAVSQAHRRQGIGRRLQQALIRRARALGCYQIRSHSSGTNAANHHLKLSLGYGVHPIVRGDDLRGVYFVLPLRPLRPRKFLK
jgi:GNAT superfamily N-acetyltransferase